MAFRISPPRLAAFAVKQLIPGVGTSSAEQRPHKSGNHLNHPSIVVKDFGPAVTIAWADNYCLLSSDFPSCICTEDLVPLELSFVALSALSKHP